MVIIISVLYNTVFFLAFRRTDEFAYLWDMAARKVPALQKIHLRR
jgi:hypothetical protein